MKSADEVRDSDKSKVLVIEDEEGLLEVIAVNLEASGYVVATASDGLEGWRAFEDEQPDLVVLDINLPTISGYRLLELFRSSSRPAVPVVALTALDFAEAEELARFELNAFITKPFHPSRLLDVVQECLAGRDVTDWSPPAKRKEQDVPWR